MRLVRAAPSATPDGGAQIFGFIVQRVEIFPLFTLFEHVNPFS
jgi:hypothetical protein